MKKLLTLALATLAITSTVAAFGADNSLGTWKLNAEKSKYTPGALPLKSLTMVREADGDGVKVTNTGERPDGSAINSSYTAKYDGSPASVSGQGAPYDTVSMKQVNANTFTWDAKSSSGKFTSHGKVAVLSDGKTMTLKAKGTDADGKPVNITLVFEKQ